MSKQISFLINIIIIFLLFCNICNAENSLIVPLKKPLLKKKVMEAKISKEMIKPLEKPKDKSTKKIKEVEIVKKKEKKINFLLPKSKPLVVKKEAKKRKKTSKYFKQKDFNIAKKAIYELEKGQWLKALSIAKKLKINQYIRLLNGNIC